MGGGKIDPWGSPFLMCLQEAGGTQAPAISGLQAKKAIFRARCGQVVSKVFRQCQELGCHHGANGMDPVIHRSCIATPIAEEPGDRRSRAAFQRAPQDIDGWFFHGVPFAEANDKGWGGTVQSPLCRIKHPESAARLKAVLCPPKPDASAFAGSPA